jgi:hypothetical protein
VANKENRLKFFNILYYNEKKNKTKKYKSRQKMKSLGEKMNHLPKFEKFNKQYTKECETPKRRINCNYKLKIDDSFKDSDHNRFSDWQKNSKGKKKVPIIDNDIKKKKIKRKI